ncbi:acetyl-CoA synthetase-like protein [Cytidiella melzeri]|nr:acetyl-CoA synthetase-like protein [Cytidiella melzeri]
MPLYRTHITILQQIATSHPDVNAFRVPQYDAETNEILQWHPITYSRFFADVELFARYWVQQFSSQGIPPRSVVGIWLGGSTYVDCVHIYSIVRAGYVPQLFSLKLPEPTIIFELLEKSNGKALIYDSSFFSPMSFSSSIPVHVAVDIRAETVADVSLPLIVESHNADETLMIFHTSGSTSGRPKVIRCSYSWWDACLVKSRECVVPKNPARQDVTTWMGSMCHIGQTFMFSGHLQHASCTVQTSSQAFPSSELMDMVARCGLNHLTIFPTYLAKHLRNSRQDPKLLGMLQNLDQIFYSGLMLGQEDEEWVYRHGIKLRNCFGNTECGAMLLSDTEWKGMNAPLVPMEGTAYGFFPTTSNVDSEAGHQNANNRFLELVILSTSPDCPDPALRSADGHYHTGDLFIELSPGRYVSRGRDDDWIKSENSLRCDTKAIEDNVRVTCSDLVEDCIVVGNGRPSPALFIEVKAGLDEEKIKKDIIRRTRHFQTRRYLHEKITSTNFVIVVPQGTLPRTASKGNIRRRAVEEAYRVELDRIYGVEH